MARRPGKPRQSYVKMRIDGHTTGTVGLSVGFLFVCFVAADYPRPGSLIVPLLGAIPIGLGWLALLFLRLTAGGRTLLWSGLRREVVERRKPKSWADFDFGAILLQIAAIPCIPVVAPMTTLELVLIEWYRVPRLARSMEFLWAITIVIFSIWLEVVGRTTIAYAFATGCVFLALNSVLSGFRKRKGVLLLFTIAEDRITPTRVLGWALILVTAFGCMHLHIRGQNPNAYHGLDTWQDGLYFSLVTLATVGYGDVYPISHAARWVTMFEILSGVVLLVVAVNATIAVWLQRGSAPAKQDG